MCLVVMNHTQKRPSANDKNDRTNGLKPRIKEVTIMIIDMKTKYHKLVLDHMVIGKYIHM
jgi:hypothetical protein